MGDPPAEVESTICRSASDEWMLEGTGAAPGIVVGQAFRYDASVPNIRRETVAPDEVGDELDLLSEAVERAQQELDTIQFLARESLDGESEAIVEAQGMMLRDEELLRSVREQIEERRVSAGAAVKAVLRQHRERLEESDDAYFQDRAGELVDLEKRLLRSLQHGKVAARIGESAIVLAQNLTATDILWLSRRGMLGCGTVQGGATSHASVIAKALGLPTVFGLEEGIDGVSTGDPVILDGEAGRIIIHPTEETLETYEQRRHESGKQRFAAVEEMNLPARTSDGHSIELKANVDSESQLDLLRSWGVEGIGLLRTEMLFLMVEGGMPSEEEQADLYRRVAENAGAGGAAIRLLDLGGDKPLPVGPSEENPSLGWRGVRVLLDQEDELLRPQLRALLRANAHGPLRVLVPMVAHLDEIRRVRTLFEEEADRLSEQSIPHDPELPLGIMVEVPAVALQADVFAEEADFFSIGTNDLTQYVLAVDRSNDRVSSRFDALHPAVLQLIRRTVAAAQTADCPMEVCGETAADPLAVPILLGLGVDALSASPRSLPQVRRTIQQLSLQDAEALAEKALTLPDAESVRRLVQDRLDAPLPSDGTVEHPVDAATTID